MCPNDELPAIITVPWALQEMGLCTKSGRRSFQMKLYKDTVTDQLYFTGWWKDLFLEVRRLDHHRYWAYGGPDLYLFPPQIYIWSKISDNFSSSKVSDGELG